ncbi:MAG: cupin domain-containing protein [Acetobacteraceae bacterium]|nr:cupin domain-containing protein [Acetobacteraceae bacterium]
MRPEKLENVVNVGDVQEEALEHGNSWRNYRKRLTPTMPREGHLGVNLCRVPAGTSACPCHTHQLEDEVFFVISGRGVFRYGEQVMEIKPGDCISCPAGTGIGHQLANPFEDDLTYLAIGMNDPNEVCTYPDSGRVSISSLGWAGFLQPAAYYEGQPDPPLIMRMARTEARR